MRANTFEIVRRCVVDGVETGWDEAYEEIEHPTIQQAQEIIASAVLRELRMYFVFEDDET